jgi:hypothetical protein
MDLDALWSLLRRRMVNDEASVAARDGVDGRGIETGCALRGGDAEPGPGEPRSAGASGGSSSLDVEITGIPSAGSSRTGAVLPRGFISLFLLLSSFLSFIKPKKPAADLSKPALPLRFRFCAVSAFFAKASDAASRSDTSR